MGWPFRPSMTPPKTLVGNKLKNIIKYNLLPYLWAAYFMKAYILNCHPEKGSEDSVYGIKEIYG